MVEKEQEDNTSKAEADGEALVHLSFPNDSDDDELAAAYQASLDENAARKAEKENQKKASNCLLYTSPSPRDQRGSRMPSSA